MRYRISRLLWNRAFVPALDLVCRAEKTTLTAPTGKIEIAMCDGWCQSWKITSHGFQNCGLGRNRFFARVLPAYEKQLRAEGRFEDADLLFRLLSAMEGPW